MCIGGSEIGHWIEANMINKKKLCVVLPAYNAGRTLGKTLQKVLFEIVDDVIPVHDASTDNTVEVAQ